MLLLCLDGLTGPQLAAHDDAERFLWTQNGFSALDAEVRTKIGQTLIADADKKDLPIKALFNVFLDRLR